MDIVEKLRAWGCDQEPFTRNHKRCQCRVANAAADEIERLRKADEVNNDIIGMLRAQLRILGHIPCVVESDEIGKAEFKMRAAARGNAN